MLMHGLALPDVHPRDAAVQAIGQAMMDVLPGLDPNDASKTSAVLRFYAAVLFSLPTLDFSQAGKGLVLPFDVELWAEEFLSRIFVLLESLEGPEVRTDQSHTKETTSSTATFLFKDDVFFPWVMEAFLLKLPQSLQLRAIKRISSFLLSAQLSLSGQECEHICAEMIDVNRNATVQHLFNPLLEILLEELPPVTGTPFSVCSCVWDLVEGGLNNVSFTHASTKKICWNLLLLSNADYVSSQNLKVCEHNAIMAC